MSIVSNNIKYLRRLNGLTQEQFARKIGIKRSLLGAYEEARANPNLTNLKNMAHAFGVSVDNLLKNDLRKIRETPDLGIPYNPSAFSPASPLMRESTPTAPQPLSAIVNRFQPPAPNLRIVARPITLKPIHQERFEIDNHQPPPPAPNGPLRFNNHYESAVQIKTLPKEEPKSPQQTIQWVSKAESQEYLTNYQTSTYLNRLPVFQVPSLPSGHYRAFEAGRDFIYPGSILIGTFVRNWYEIKDETRYVLVSRNQGIMCRTVFNQVKSDGTLLLRADLTTYPDLVISIKEVLEVWEIKAFVSTTLPSQLPSYDKLKSILKELKEELNRNDLTNNFLA